MCTSWHFDATRLLCADISGRPAYVYFLHVPLLDEYRRSRKGCAPLAAAVFVTCVTDADQLRFFLEALLARVLALQTPATEPAASTPASAPAEAAPRCATVH